MYCGQFNWKLYWVSPLHFWQYYLFEWQVDTTSSMLHTLLFSIHSGGSYCTLTFLICRFVPNHSVILLKSETVKQIQGGQQLCYFSPWRFPLALFTINALLLSGLSKNIFSHTFAVKKWDLICPIFSLITLDSTSPANKQTRLSHKVLQETTMLNIFFIYIYLYTFYTTYQRENSCR